MRFIVTSAWKDLVSVRRDPVALLMWIAIPLILGLMLNAVFGGGNPAPQGRLLVADEDDTIVSNGLTEPFRREPLSKTVVIEKVSRTEGRARIDHGDGSALLIIPKGLADCVLRNEPYTLQLFTNPSQRIVPQIIQQTLSIMVEGEFYLQQVAGAQLRVVSQPSGQRQAPLEQQVASISIAIYDVVDRLRKFLNPPVIRLDTNVVQEKLQQKSFAAIFFPATIFMAVLFLANALASSIWEERNAGTLRRLRMTCAPLAGFLAGRLLSIILIFFGLALAGVSVGPWVAHVPVANFSGAVLWLVFSGSALFLLLLLMVMQSSTQRGANVLSNLVVFPLSMLGGSFFPFEVMPSWMARIGSKTPNGWAVMQFKAIVDGSATAEKLALAAAGLLIVSALAFVLALRKLGRGFTL